VRAKTDHPVFLAAYTTDPVFFYKEAPEDGGMWSPPQLSSDEAVSLVAVGGDLGVRAWRGGVG
jgi:hypothetical protein